MKEKYWNYMVALKYQLFYLGEYIDHSYKWDTYLNWFLACASTSSIGAWAIWKEFNYVWSIIIAGSQVINALKAQLPYSKRTKFLPKLYSELSELFNEYDYWWYKVSNDKLSEEEINDKLKELVEKDNKISNKYLMENHLPVKNKFCNKAQIQLENYYIN